MFLLLVVPGCGGPKPLDTGAPVIEVGRELTHTLWQRDLGRSLEFPPVWFSGSWLAAPTEGALWRLDAETGTEIWKRKLPATATASPLLCRNTVVLSTDAPSGEVLGFRLDTGEELWKWSRAITLPAARDSALVVAARGGTVLRLDPETGEVVWSRKQKGVGWKKPVFFGDMVIVPGRPDSLVAYRLAGGERIWNRAVGSWPALAEDAGIAVASTDDSTLVLLDPDTGEIRERTHLDSMAAGAPVVWKGRVIVALRKGEVAAYDAGTLELLWTRPLESPLVSPPVPYQGQLFQAGPRGLIYALDPETGEALGLYRHPEPLVSAPRAAGTTLAAGGDRGTLVVYRRTP